jgi:PAS domain S-box-containing protein
VLNANDTTYEAFFDLSVDMLCIAGQDGYFKRLNPVWTQTLGFTQEELMARPYMDFVHPNDQPATAAEKEKLIRGAKVTHFKNRYRCRDGSYRWLEWAATPAESGELIHAVARDVTQEVDADTTPPDANLAAATRLALLTALIDAIGVGVVLIDREMLVAHWNKEATRLTGIQADKVLGLPAALLGEAIAPRVEDYPSVQSHLQHVFSPSETAQFQMVILEPRRDVEVRASPALLPDGRQVGTVIVLNDITAANDLDRAKDELVAMVSHELRTPLASLVGFSELLLSREFSGEQRKKYLETMLKEGQRLTELINDFLDLQRMEGGFKRLALGPASLPTLITRVVAIAGENSRSPIEVDLPRDLPLVVADTNAIHQVLLNLLSNARKYSPGGGLIRVEAGVVDGFVEVSVRDHGLGIPADAIPRLFKKFYRVAGVDRRGISGTGLGLAICRGIVEAHGGRIALESEGLGHGSRFYFTLQAVDRKVTAGDVLLIEDDTGFARLLEAELSLRGLSSVWAADAETADQLIGQTGARAVVLDLMLPGVSGEDFLAGLRTSHKSDVPVVVVTIKELEATESLALRSAGVVAILKKHSGAAKEAAEFVAAALESRPAGA